MKTEVRMTGQLFDEMWSDLVRPHPFALERVGFVMAKIGSLAGERKAIILTRFQSIPDEHYIEDSSVGARIGNDAMTAAMHAVYHGRPGKEGVFHIHVHDHYGETGLSWVDRRELPPMIPGFQSVGRAAPHGIMILSRDHGTAWVWHPCNGEPVVAERVTVVGAPLRMWDQRSSQ